MRRRACSAGTCSRNTGRAPHAPHSAGRRAGQPLHSARGLPGSPHCRPSPSRQCRSARRRCACLGPAPAARAGYRPRGLLRTIASGPPSCRRCRARYGCPPRRGQCRAPRARPAGGPSTAPRRPNRARRCHAARRRPGTARGLRAGKAALPAGPGVARPAGRRRRRGKIRYPTSSSGARSPSAAVEEVRSCRRRAPAPRRQAWMPCAEVFLAASTRQAYVLSEIRPFAAA